MVLIQQDLEVFMNLLKVKHSLKLLVVLKAQVLLLKLKAQRLRKHYLNLITLKAKKNLLNMPSLG